MSFKDYLESPDEHLFEMANFGPKSTGLSEVIWVSVKTANHGPRIKIFEGAKAKGKNFSVTIEDEPKVIGKLLVNEKELQKKAICH